MSPFEIKAVKPRDNRLVYYLLFCHEEETLWKGILTCNDDIKDFSHAETKFLEQGKYYTRIAPIIVNESHDG